MSQNRDLPSNAALAIRGHEDGQQPADVAEACEDVSSQPVEDVGVVYLEKVLVMRGSELAKELFDFGLLDQDLF